MSCIAHIILGSVSLLGLTGDTIAQIIVNKYCSEEASTATFSLCLTHPIRTWPILDTEKLLRWLMRRVYPQQRITDVASVLRLGWISSMMLADTTFLKPERRPRSHQTDERKVKDVAFLENFKGLGSLLHWFLQILTTDFCFSIFHFQ